MLRFKKETDSERIERLRQLILDNYVESEETGEMLISEADLIFMLNKATENIEADKNREEQAVNEEPFEENDFGDNIMPFDEQLT